MFTDLTVHLTELNRNRYFAHYDRALQIIELNQSPHFLNCPDPLVNQAKLQLNLIACESEFSIFTIYEF